MLDLVNAAPAVQAEALPFLRIMFVFSSGMLVFFMLSGALRSAGDARTPMILGVGMTVLNLMRNVALIRGLGPIPAFGTAGAAMGTGHRLRPGGLQGTGDTKSPLYISIVSQVLVPLGICFVIQQAGKLDPLDIWLAILFGHATRCALSVLRFNQGRWREIEVEIERSRFSARGGELRVGSEEPDSLGQRLRQRTRSKGSLCSGGRPSMLTACWLVTGSSR